MNTYGIIYADPPWSYQNDNPRGGVRREYPTMTDADILGMEIPKADDCVLFLWATMPRLPLALQVIEAWGFEYKSGAVWDKERLGIGYWFRGQHELLLVGVRGKVSPPPPDLRIRSVIRVQSGQHSSKPDYVREWIAKCYPAPRLELFTRIKRPGWTPHGNQVEEDLLSNLDATSAQGPQQSSQATSPEHQQR